METNVLSEETRRKAQAYFRNKLLANLGLILLGTFIIGMFLHGVQANAAIHKQKESNRHALAEVAVTLDRNYADAEMLTGIYHEGNREALGNIERLFDNGLFEKLERSETSVRTQVFSELSVKSGLPYVLLLEEDGTILASWDESLFGKNPAATSLMTQENLNRILKGTGDRDRSPEPVRVENMHGTFYFYSGIYTYGGRDYVIAIGTDSAVLDEEIGSLKDVSSVISRMTVINNGFLFAVDRDSDLFLYFKDGDELLSGQNAFEAGLSREAMTDGFNGVETIRGKRYYCTSRAFDDVMVIVASADADAVMSGNSGIIAWTVVGFNIVMLLCLAYTIIVRNDFVRREVKTDLVVLRKDSDNPAYFNRTIFRKVMPLILIGVLAVFGISFYSQTLLEITEGIERSNVVLDVVSGRYEESLESRGLVEEYYSKRFLDTANMISFMVEEEPEILNDYSDRYHRTYDETGEAQYILDDEGNPLKSVSGSQLLQRICDYNQIDAIYIFNEDGRTIATNTNNWFFSLSMDESDQSYAFRSILEGKRDSYQQTSMTNDLGEDAQFFGVVMHYYTKLDGDGNTVYVSRFDYEKACSEEGVTDGRTAGGISKHSSLLQIELDEDLTGKILSPMSTESILSTQMLGKGAIVLFDNTDEHRCLYSPVEASIGRTAAELGISANAFKDTNDYYGFTNINGIMYFIFFRYVDGYYFATAIPKSSMYTSRAIIAAVTAVVSLILTILLLTITVTNKNEEELYATTRESMEKRTWNSRIFNIILPSGRDTSTVGAEARWDNRRISWGERSPEIKLGKMIKRIVGAIIVFIAIYMVVARNNRSSESVIRYILSANWDKGPNIFAFSACFLVFGAMMIALELIAIPIKLSTALLGARGETIGHLLLSVLKYGGAIGAVFYCLYLLGIDSASLLASAGILSLVIGLGAQSLIRDIIAGIFIVFEGEFRVGDIVTINGFRGTVIDIGLRTTKILADGNIKIYNNSDISGVLNMTKETSVATVSSTLKYAVDVDRLEEVMERELPKLGSKNSKIVSGPTYRGITDVSGNKIKITVKARCSEENIESVTRYLNRELLKLLFQEGFNAGPKAAPAILDSDDEEED